jgi:hypothetical protein
MMLYCASISISHRQEVEEGQTGPPPAAGPRGRAHASASSLETSVEVSIRPP